MGAREQGSHRMPRATPVERVERRSMLHLQDVSAQDMSSIIRQQIDAAIELNAQPRRTRGGSIVIDVPGARFRALVSSAGRVSAAGRRYYDQTGIEPPRNGLDPNSQTYRRRRRELTKLQNGQEVSLRQYDPLGQTWRLTRAGKAYYAGKRDRYLLKWPALVSIIRRNGTAYRRQDYLPLNGHGFGRSRGPREPQ